MLGGDLWSEFLFTECYQPFSIQIELVSLGSLYLVVKNSSVRSKLLSLIFVTFTMYHNSLSYGLGDMENEIYQYMTN